MKMNKMSKTEFTLCAAIVACLILSIIVTMCGGEFDKLILIPTAFVAIQYKRIIEYINNKN